MAKRQRKQQPTASKTEDPGSSRQSTGYDSALLTLPSDVLERILTTLDALSLVHISLVCRVFSSKHRPSGLRVTEKVARDLVVAACGLEQAQRFRRLSWLERLYLEDAAVGFQTSRWQAIAAQQAANPQEAGPGAAAAAAAAGGGGAGAAAPAPQPPQPQQQQQQQQQQVVANAAHQQQQGAVPHPLLQAAAAGANWAAANAGALAAIGAPAAVLAAAAAPAAAAAAGGGGGEAPAANAAANAQANAYFTFKPSRRAPNQLSIDLQGMGPKMLVSDLSTAEQPVLRWRLSVRGNTAVEFGVVPLCLEDEDKALHKAQQDERKFERLTGRNQALPDAERPVGFCSSITVGSMLHFKTAVMKGTVVELVARRGRLEVLIQNPEDGQELFWQNTRTVPKPYKGPREVRFEQDFSASHDVKLALTSWAHGAFDVLHPVQLAGSGVGGRVGSALCCGRRSDTGSSLGDLWRSHSSEESTITQ